MPDGDFSKPIVPLSAEQGDAHDDVLRWHRDPRRQIYHLRGLAGVGKTEVIVRIGCELGAQFAAFTGKAASVLRQRGATNATTLHSLIHGAPVVRDGELVWRRRRGDKLDFVVADECTQIDGKLGRDLLATGTKVLVTGDALQLPPVSGSAFFAGEPDFTLTEIHRQAAGSQPLRLATAVRKGGNVRAGKFDLDAVVEADIVICALNRTRRKLNRLIRRARGISERDPVVGDRVVCLRNNRKSGTLNGTLWTTTKIERVPGEDFLLDMSLIDDVGNEVTVTAHDDGFHAARLDLLDPEYGDLDLFGFGFSLTCHKSQGSEWQRVVVIDETSTPGFSFIAGSTPLAEYKRRWLYTGITRARSSVTLMGAPR